MHYNNKTHIPYWNHVRKPHEKRENCNENLVSTHSSWLVYVPFTNAHANGQKAISTRPNHEQLNQIELNNRARSITIEWCYIHSQQITLMFIYLSLSLSLIRSCFPPDFNVMEPIWVKHAVAFNELLTFRYICILVDLALGMHWGILGKIEEGQTSGDRSEWIVNTQFSFFEYHRTYVRLWGDWSFCWISLWTTHRPNDWNVSRWYMIIPITCGVCIRCETNNLCGMFGLLE